MPEDPPEYGEDGLHVLNDSNEYLADEVVVVVDGEAVVKSTKNKKKTKTDGKKQNKNKKMSSSDTDGEADSNSVSISKTTPNNNNGARLGAVDDFKQPSELDIAGQIMERERRERAERVERRRNPKNPVLRALQTVIPYGGIVSSAFSLASSTIGGGIIGLPVSYQMSGIGMATIYLVVVVAMAIYSFVLLATVSQKTGLFNWELIARRLMGRGWDYAVVFVMWVLCFGGDISYIIALKSILTGFLKNTASASDYLKSEPGYRLITSMLWLVVILPMCTLKEINSLRHVSTLAILFVVFFAITVIIRSGQTLHRRGMRDDLVYFQTGNTAINGLSNLLFAFIAQVNGPECMMEMQNFTVTRMFLAALLGMSMCAVLYFLTGLFGYLDFGPTVSDSILSMFNPMEDHLMAVSYVGMMLKICVGFALHLIPCRDAVYYVAGTNVHHMRWWQNALVCALQAALALVAGLFIPRISTVFGLLGGFCGGFIGFIFPSFFMMYSGGFTPSRLGWAHFLGTYALLIVGVIAVVWGTSAAVYGAANTDWSS